MLRELVRRWGGWKMDGYVKAFIACSLFYLLAGAVLGLVMSLHDALLPGSSGWTWLLLASHTHVMLIGWVSMMIFGVGYHMIPRFSGALVWSARLAWWHWTLGNVGLLGMAFGFWLNRLGDGRFGWLLGTAGTLEAAGFLLFAGNLVVSLWKAAEPHPSALPVLAASLAARLAKRAAGAIEATSTPAQVLGAHPQLLPIFLTFGFSGLADPEHVRTMGSRVTLAQAAQRHGVNLEELLAALNAALAG